MSIQNGYESVGTSGLELVEQIAAEARNITGIIGVGAIAIGSEVSENILLAGTGIAVSSLAFEGIRRLMANFRHKAEDFDARHSAH